MRPVHTSASDVLLMEEIEAGLMVLTFNRPEVMNALNRDLTHALSDAFRAVSEDSNVQALILRGQGGNFMAGGDIHLFCEALELPAIERRDYFYQLVGYVNDLMRLLVEMPKPIITCVEGVAAGFGVSLALQADNVLVHPKANFTMAYNQMGLSPDGGASYILPRAVGVVRARGLFAGSTNLSAHQAHDFGLVTDVVENTFEHAKKAAHSLMALPQEALVQTRALLLDKEAFYQHLEHERQAFATCVATDAFAQRVHGFLNKRKTS
ncbi:MAG: enoyl-CoA hydratase/isomerase family protein [Holosporales bacterium]